MRLSTEAKAGITVLLSIVLFIAMVWAVGFFDFKRDNEFEFTVSYKTVDGLREGAPVRYAGVNVGSVADIQLVRNGVLVNLSIDRDLLIPADSSFAIANSGVLGDKYIEIYPGTADLPLEAAATVVGIDPIILDDILNEVGSTLHHLNWAISGFAQLTESAELQTNLAETGQLLKDTVSGLKTTVDQVANVALAVERVVDDVEEFSGQLPQVNLAQTFKDFESFTDDLARLNLAESLGLVDQLVTELNGIPFADLFTDFSVLTEELSAVPIAEIGTNIKDLSKKIADIPLDDMVGDLQYVTQELRDFGWTDMSDQLLAFTHELSSFEIEVVLGDALGDLNTFTDNLANLELESVVSGINNLVVNLEEITTMVEPTSIANIVSDLEGISANVHGASDEIEQIVSQLNADLRKFSDDSLVALDDVKKIVAGIEQSVANVNQFIDDVVSEGETARGVKYTLANVQDGTTELVSLLEAFNTSFSSESGPLGELQTTVDNLQKLNRDIGNIRSVGENVEIRSNLGASLNLLENRRLMADVEFEFWQQEGNSFLLVGLTDILGEDGNQLQLQYGRQTGILRQRYGIIDTSLGAGFDGQVSDKWNLTAEIKALTRNRPQLTLGADYAWTPEWIIGINLNDVLKLEGLSIGVERRF